MSLERRQRLENTCNAVLGLHIKFYTDELATLLDDPVAAAGGLLASGAAKWA